MSTKSIILTPLDTLFFRGAEPMEAGENHFTSYLFPPMPTTLMGALRTAILVQNGISFREFVRIKSPDKQSNIGSLLGTPDLAGFDFGGPMFVFEKRGERIPIFPAPSHWFTDKENLISTKQGKEVAISVAKPLSRTAKEFGLCASITQETNSFWNWACPAGDEELKSLEGHWVTADSLEGKVKLRFISKIEDLVFGIPSIIPQSALFHDETRVGLARNNFERTAIRGRLYTTHHIRLSEGVGLLLLPDHDLSEALKKNGVLQLGGEQRVASYQISDLEIPQGKETSSIWLALSPVKSSGVRTHSPIGVTSGKLRRIGGWEMKRGQGNSGNNQGFHRNLEGWHPAGTVLFFDEPRAVPNGWWGL